MSGPTIWWRQFVRSAAPDIDTVADASFRAKNFTDFFGTWLQQGNNASLQTFDAVMTVFYNLHLQDPKTYSVSIFVIADGAFITPPATGDWFDPQCRLVAAIKLLQGQWKNAVVFVVGPSAVKTPNTFLQAGSWDGTKLNFYGVDAINGSQTQSGWVFQGTSFGAFDETGSAYLGPFDGHVNGATIMKELHTPWYHWLSGQNTNFRACLSADETAFLQTIPYLTGTDQTVFDGAVVVGADQLEPIVEQIVEDWYNTRVANDFTVTSGSSTVPKTQPSNIHRWMAHLLMTTTVNFATGQGSGQNLTAPPELFYNKELFSQDADFVQDMTANGAILSSLNLSYDPGMYTTAVKTLRLSLLQEWSTSSQPVTPPSGVTMEQLPKGTLGGGKETDSFDFVNFILAAENTEGEPWVVLQTSYEDAQGVLSMQGIGDNGTDFPSEGLLTNKAVKALLMLDFWNPVYSWRRGVLMQYLPPVTNLISGASPQYDLEKNFVAAIKASPFLKDQTSPEFQFIQLYANAIDTDYQTSIENYFGNVSDQLATAQGIQDYLSLAESHKRIFRPLPLDEFGAQLPYALGIPPTTPLIEMTAAGTIQNMPQRGVDFFSTWTGTLHGFDPQILPFGETSGASQASKENTTLSGRIDHPIVPKANASRCPVTARTRSRAVPKARCPVMTSKKSGLQGVDEGRNELSIGVSPSTVPINPTWKDDVSKLFSAPYWVSNPTAVGKHWQNQMCAFSPPAPQALNLDLFDIASVARNAITVYEHLRSRSMPITSDPAEYWPDDALETFRLWANQGFRNISTDKIQTNTIIPAPIDPPFKMRVRKDILALTPLELQTYRAKLDDILQVGSLNSKWQEMGFLHAEWCLHYQEGFALWHRAYLIYVEELIDFPIPYWNGYATVTSDPSSPYAGIPKIFLEETYVHPTGQVRKNPLKYALAANGLNKRGTGPYPERFPVLLNGPKDHGWAAKIELFEIYHQQIAGALSKTSYSLPEDPTGYPWANLPAFSDNQPTCLYPDVARQYFDGSFEQPHDNYHGWIGPDMADNTYTAFDPIFLCYHANIDRILEMYLRKGPQQFTSSFPLRPFTNNGTQLAYSDPREYVYTTIGDMAKPSQSNHYLYAPPVLADYTGIMTPLTAPKARGGTAIQVKKAHEIEAITGIKPAAPTPAPIRPTPDSSHTNPTQVVAAAAAVHAFPGPVSLTHPPNPQSLTPLVIFPNIACVQSSFQIDIFVSPPSSRIPSPRSNPDYIGRMTRLGMGPGRGGTVGLKNRGRCVKSPISRVVDAGRCKQRLVQTNRIEMVVTDLGTGTVVEEEEWMAWQGFLGVLVWV